MLKFQKYVLDTWGQSLLINFSKAIIVNVSFKWHKFIFMKNFAVLSLLFIIFRSPVKISSRTISSLSVSSQKRIHWFPQGVKGKAAALLRAHMPTPLTPNPSWGSGFVSWFLELEIRSACGVLHWLWLKRTIDLINYLVDVGFSKIVQCRGT